MELGSLKDIERSKLIEKYGIVIQYFLNLNFCELIYKFKAIIFKILSYVSCAGELSKLILNLIWKSKFKILPKKVLNEKNKNGNMLSQLSKHIFIL